MRRKLSFEEFVARDKAAMERRLRDPAFVEEQRKLRQLTESERDHWVETGEWPERLHAGVAQGMPEKKLHPSLAVMCHDCPPQNCEEATLGFLPDPDRTCEICGKVVGDNFRWIKRERPKD